MRTDQKLFCLKCLLSIFLILLWLMGSAVFGVLLWLRLDFWTNEYLEVDKSLDRYLILIYVSLVDGALILVFSVMGLVGGVKGFKWCLVVYLVPLCLAFGLTLAGSVYGFVYREELRNTIAKNDLIEIVVKERYTGESMNRFTRAVDIMQSELGCCGGDNPLDYTDSNWYRAIPEYRENMAPLSCCQDYHRYEGSASTNNRHNYCPIWQPFQPGQDKYYNEKIHREGCRTALVSFLEKYIVVVAGIVITAGVLQLVCIILVSCVIHVLNKLYVPQPDDIVYDMARNQEKSPYPSRGDYRDYYA
ncbi:tetraspanin-7-like [Babylonia areolata]|uniref:tetraspanin-7-like n=1 Tax=Babylonia areolata TaxID=304850 RepID=UPI003FD44D15